ISRRSSKSARASTVCHWRSNWRQRASRYLACKASGGGSTSACTCSRPVPDLLGIFVGGFSLEGARQLLSDERVDSWAALDLLSTLIDKSLVVVDAGDPPRYRLLETTRAFALERLAATGALGSARRKHVLATVATLRALSPWDSPYIRAVNVAPD